MIASERKGLAAPWRRMAFAVCCSAALVVLYLAPVADGQGDPPQGRNRVTMTEADGSPSVRARTVIWPNGSITDDGGAQITVDPTASLGAVSPITTATDGQVLTWDGNEVPPAWRNEDLPAATWAAALAAGAISGGTSPQISSGDALTAPAGVDLRLLAPSGQVTDVVGDVVVAHASEGAGDTLTLSHDATDARLASGSGDIFLVPAGSDVRLGPAGTPIYYATSNDANGRAMFYAVNNGLVGATLQATSSTFTPAATFDTPNTCVLQADASTVGWSIGTVGPGDPIRLATNSTFWWSIEGTTGDLLAESDNATDIGASGATRPRTVYVGTSVVTPAIASAADLNITPAGDDVILTWADGSSATISRVTTATVITSGDGDLVLDPSSGAAQIGGDLVVWEPARGAGDTVTISHDATDGSVTTGSGDLSLDAAGGQVQLAAGDDLTFATGGGISGVSSGVLVATRDDGTLEGSIRQLIGWESHSTSDALTVAETHTAHSNQGATVTVVLTLPGDPPPGTAYYVYDSDVSDALSLQPESGDSITVQAGALGAGVAHTVLAYTGGWVVYEGGNVWTFGDTIAGSAADLATTLAVAAVTGGTDLQISSGDALTAPAGVDLRIEAPSSQVTRMVGDVELWHPAEAATDFVLLQADGAGRLVIDPSGGGGWTLQIDDGLGEVAGTTSLRLASLGGDINIDCSASAEIIFTASDPVTNAANDWVINTGTNTGMAFASDNAISFVDNTDATAGAQNVTMQAGVVNLTDATPTQIASFTMADDTFAGGVITYSIEATDAGGETQCTAGTATFAIVDDVGGVVASIDNDEQSGVSSGSLTGAFSVTATDDQDIEINCTATSSLTTNLLRIRFEITAPTAQALSIP